MAWSSARMTLGRFTALLVTIGNGNERPDLGAGASVGADLEAPPQGTHPFLHAHQPQTTLAPGLPDVEADTVVHDA